jgi:hypothetical protein
MASTYEPIQSYTGTGSSNIITFTSIPATYTDLVLVIDGEGTSPSASQDITIRFNNDTSSTYSETYLRGDGSTASSGRYSEPYLTSASSWRSGRRYNHIVNIMNYANTTTYKTTLVRTNYAGGDIAALAILWRATPAAINRVDVNINNGNYASGSTFTLYGIKAA